MLHIVICGRHSPWVLQLLLTEIVHRKQIGTPSAQMAPRSQLIYLAVSSAAHPSTQRAEALFLSGGCGLACTGWETVSANKIRSNVSAAVGTLKLWLVHRELSICAGTCDGCW